MPLQHILLALLVTVIWGVNFVFIKFALIDLPPTLLCALRFFLAFFPAIFFIKRPSAPLRLILLYGLLTFSLQFYLIFIGMHAGITPGLTSLLIQVQVFCSMFFAAILVREMPNFLQILGALVAFSGMGLIAMHLDNQTVTLTGFLFILGAAAAWGLGNIVTKKIGSVNMLSLVVWGSFVACIPLTLLSLIVDGPTQIVADLHHLSLLGLVSTLYIVYVSTWIGYGVWNWLVSHHAVPTIVPFTLLVPVFGILSSILICHEPFQSWKLLTGLFIISGLCINILGTRFSIKKTVKAPEFAE